LVSFQPRPSTPNWRTSDQRILQVGEFDIIWASADDAVTTNSHAIKAMMQINFRLKGFRNMAKLLAYTMNYEAIWRKGLSTV